MAPQNLGNAAGDKIQAGLAPVGNTVGKGLEIAGKPVGGLVEPLVGGITKSGRAFGEATGVGAGNNPDTYGKKGIGMEGDKRYGTRCCSLRRLLTRSRYQSAGGEEQNAGNPLGLNEETLK